VFSSLFVLYLIGQGGSQLEDAAHFGLLKKSTKLQHVPAVCVLARRD
jgi:hypothetical protein